MIRLANLLYLEGRYLIIEEPDAVSVDYDDSLGGACAFYTQMAKRAKVLLPDFVVEQLTQTLSAPENAPSESSADRSGQKED